jgi:putative inorganic carbon (hco3(-)) transporter
VIAATVLADGLERLGLVAAALLAAGALVAPTVRWRALTTGGALALAPILVVAHIWNGEQLRAIRDRPAVAAAGLVVGLGAVALAALALRRRPAVAVVAALVAMPFRIPLHVAGTTANLLLPLYLVIAAGALARVLAALTDPPPEEPALPGVRLRWALAAAVVLYAVQAVYSPDFDTALQHVGFFYVPFALLFGLVADVRWTPALQRACVAALAGLGVIFCAVGAVEFATRSILLNDKLKTHNAYTPSFRVNSLFYDPNIYGRFLVVVILVVAAIVTVTGERRRVAGAVVVLAVLWTGLVTTLSESSFGALLVGLAVLVALRVRMPRPLTLVAAAVVLAVAAVALPALVGAGPVSLHRVTTGRSDLVRGGAELFAARPVQGWGSGSFTREYRDQRKGTSRAAVSASHTTPLTVAVEQGLPGLVVYVLLLLAAWQAAVRGPRGSPATAALAAVVAALAFHSLLYAAFLEEPLLWTALGALAALGAVAGRPTAERRDTAGGRAAATPAVR